jgi:hypothetical protein
LKSPTSSYKCSNKIFVQRIIYNISNYSNIKRNAILFVDVVSSDIFDEDWEKRDYTRSISKKTRQGLDWFRPSRGVIALHPVSLYYAMGKLVALYELQATSYIEWRTAL